MQSISNFIHSDTSIAYWRDAIGNVGLELLPTSHAHLADASRPGALEPLVQVKLAQDDHPFGFSAGRSMRNSDSVAQMRFAGQDVRQDTGRTVVDTQMEDPRGYRYTHTLVMDGHSPALEVCATIVNNSAAAIRIEMLSSFTLGRLSAFGDGLRPGSMVLHRLRSTWSAEGRLVSEPLEDLQLEPSWQRYSINSLRFGQVGSMPVRGWVPFVALEDTTCGVTWAAATTHASSWQIEAERKDDGLSLSGGIADREFGHWVKVLQPGERFTTPKAVLAVVQGGVDKAAARLAENVRKSLVLPPVEETLPVIFNEFCTSWGTPTQQSVESMCDVLQGRGCEYFVIDAGWYDTRPFGEATLLGEWEPNPTAFPQGLKAAVETINSHGMRAGLWFEFEIAGRDSACFDQIEHLLALDGVPVTSGNRRFWDMRDSWVQDYLAEKVIGLLRDCGFEYLKVDYNESTSIGCDGGDSPGEALYEQILASQRFFRRIRAELPQLVLEVCSSGGHRLAHSFMEIGCMASFSDAHECDEIPIIAANMHRMILPRQSQIWAVLKQEAPDIKFYYQLTSGMLGRLCLSGDILALSTAQWAIVEAGIAFYRKAVPFIDTGKSRILGPKQLSYRHPESWQAVERRTPDGRALLVLHTFHGAPMRLSVSTPGHYSRAAASFSRPGIQMAVADGKLTLDGLQPFDGIALILEE